MAFGDPVCSDWRSGSEKFFDDHVAVQITSPAAGEICAIGVVADAVTSVTGSYAALVSRGAREHPSSAAVIKMTGRMRKRVERIATP